MKYNLTTSEITLHGLRFHAFHGVLEQERVVGNDYEVTVKISYDIRRAVATDNVAYTLNYAEVYEVVKRVMEQSCNLIERVAWRIGETILNEFPFARAARVSVLKLNPPMGADCKGAEVQIKLKRSRKDED